MTNYLSRPTEGQQDFPSMGVNATILTSACLDGEKLSYSAERGEVFDSKSVMVFGSTGDRFQFLDSPTPTANK